jgi:3-oxoadipate enol-lactonase
MSTADEAITTTVHAPPLPPGREVELPGRGTMFLRELHGPWPEAPAIVLLHGWTATADMNWFTCFEPLARHYRVLAPDHRGHGRGIRSRRTFRLEDCADDVAALCDVLGVRTAFIAGYSMGGPVAMLLWQRHRTLVRGLVLCATAPYFSRSREERLSFLGLSGLAALSRATPAKARTWLTEQVYLQRRAQTWDPWAIEQASQHDWRMILEAGKAIGEFSAREWMSSIDVPTSVMITMSDQIVPVRRQIRLFEAIPDAEAFRVDGGHDAVVANSAAFVHQLERATLSVRERAGC